MTIYRPNLRRIGAAAVIFASLAGCATSSPPKPDEFQIKQFFGRGYLTDDQFSIATTDATWAAGSDTYHVALTVPTTTGLYPLVIYLPALNETRSAGERWRNAWAQAGYTVLSLQLLPEDEGAWSSTKTRAGELAGIARDRYSAKNVAARLTALEGAWKELGRRRRQGEAPLDRIDLSRVAIAGYDLGAYTAMAVAGEQIRGVAAHVQDVPVRAVIALSPYADFSGAAFGSRYQSIRCPVLSVTSDIDWDSMGLVSSQSIRRASFEYMPQGDKYLLTLAGLPHSAMGGSNNQHEAANDSSQMQEKYESRSRARPQGGGHGGAHLGGHGGHAPASGQTAHRGQEHAGSSVSDVISPTALAIGMVAIQGVSTAFLDAYVKQDPIAQEWLDKDAKRWLGERGEIRKK